MLERRFSVTPRLLDRESTFASERRQSLHPLGVPQDILSSAILKLVLTALARRLKFPVSPIQEAGRRKRLRESDDIVGLLEERESGITKTEESAAWTHFRETEENEHEDLHSVFIAQSSFTF